MAPLKKRRICTDENIGGKVSPSVEKWNKIWDDMTKRLVQYKLKHGNCLVPQRYSLDPRLGRWVNKQRENKDSLSPERRKQLDSIGFVWTVVKREPWDTMFDRLVAYKEMHGDCLVPQRHKADPKLGSFVREQRKNRSNLSTHRRARLESIGFVWRLRAGTKQPDDPQKELIALSNEFNATSSYQLSPRVATPYLEAYARKLHPFQARSAMEVLLAQQLLLRRQLLCRQEQERKVVQGKPFVSLKVASTVKLWQCNRFVGNGVI